MGPNDFKEGFSKREMRLILRSALKNAIKVITLLLPGAELSSFPGDLLDHEIIDLNKRPIEKSTFKSIFSEIEVYR